MFIPTLLGASLLAKQLWYALPLVVSVSLVYGATRHELLRPILEHAYRTAFWMVTFIGVIFLILLAITLYL
jgi:hypothetical protein